MAAGKGAANLLTTSSIGAAAGVTGTAGIVEVVIGATGFAINGEGGTTDAGATDKTEADGITRAGAGVGVGVATVAGIAGVETDAFIDAVFGAATGAG